MTRVDANYKKLIGFPKNFMPALLGVLWARPGRARLGGWEGDGYFRPEVWKRGSHFLFRALNIHRLRFHIPTRRGIKVWMSLKETDERLGFKL